LPVTVSALSAKAASSAHGVGAEQHGAAVAGRAQAKGEKLADQRGLHWRHGKTVGDAFLQLAHVRQVQVRIELGLAEQDDLQQLVAARFQVRQQADFLERLQRHGLRLFHQQQHLAAGRVAGDQFVVQAAQHLVGAAPGRLQAQLGGDGVHHLLGPQAGIDQVDDVDIVRQPALHHAAEHGLAAADLAGHLDDALAVGDGVQQRVEDLAARVAAVKKGGIRRDAEGRLVQAEVLVIQVAVKGGRGHVEHSVFQGRLFNGCTA
jgi:hypothetical protein